MPVKVGQPVGGLRGMLSDRLRRRHRRRAGTDFEGSSPQRIVSVTKVVCVAPPPEPVMVSRYVPFGGAAMSEMVRVDWLVVELGLKLPVAPAGKPLTLRATRSEKPADGVTVIA